MPYLVNGQLVTEEVVQLQEAQLSRDPEQQNFRGSALFRAAHIVKHTDHGQDEKLAREGIEEAMAMLTNGTPFSEVADRCSDCPGKGGDLGEFIAGTMVPEFENA